MPMHRTVNGVEVALTPAEETQLLAERQVALAARPMERWRQRMAETDADLARCVEDVLANLVSGTPIPQPVLDKLAARVALRAQKP